RRRVPQRLGREATPERHALDCRSKGDHMPKYMFVASYTAEGTKGLLKDGGSARKSAVEKLAKSAGGKIEHIWYAFGEDDVYLVGELPDNATAAAISLTVGASGDERVLGLARAVGHDGAISGKVRHPHAVERLGERADLVHLDQDRVGDPLVDAAPEDRRVGDEDVVAHQLRRGTELSGEQLPAL